MALNKSDTRFFTSLLLCAFLAYCGAAHAQCGSERRTVKTLQDNPALPSTVIGLTIADLVHLPPPHTISNHLPRQSGVEHSLMTLDVNLLAWKLEADQDYHLVIADPTTHDTMIAEIPGPHCVPKKESKLFSQLRFFIRQQTNVHYPKSSHLYQVSPPLKLEIKGWGFFDKIHGQTGVAPNGIELHPVIQLKLEPNDGTQ